VAPHPPLHCPPQLALKGVCSFIVYGQQGQVLNVFRPFSINSRSPPKTRLRFSIVQKLPSLFALGICRGPLVSLSQLFFFPSVRDPFEPTLVCENSFRRAFSVFTFNFSFDIDTFLPTTDLAAWFLSDGSHSFGLSSRIIPV